MTAAEADPAAEIERLQARVVALGRERDQGLEQQTASDDVIALISRTGGSDETALQAIADTALRLCHGVGIASGQTMSLSGPEFRSPRRAERSQTARSGSPEAFSATGWRWSGYASGFRGAIQCAARVTPASGGEDWTGKRTYAASSG